MMKISKISSSVYCSSNTALGLAWFTILQITLLYTGRVPLHPPLCPMLDQHTCNRCHGRHPEWRFLLVACFYLGFRRVDRCVQHFFGCNAGIGMRKRRSTLL